MSSIANSRARCSGGLHCLVPGPAALLLRAREALGRGAAPAAPRRSLARAPPRSPWTSHRTDQRLAARRSAPPRVSRKCRAPRDRRLRSGPSPCGPGAAGKAPREDMVWPSRRTACDVTADSAASPGTRPVACVSWSYGLTDVRCVIYYEPLRRPRAPVARRRSTEDLTVVRREIVVHSRPPRRSDARPARGPRRKPDILAPNMSGSPFRSVLTPHKTPHTAPSACEWLALRLAQCAPLHKPVKLSKDFGGAARI